MCKKMCTFSLFLLLSVMLIGCGKASEAEHRGNAFILDEAGILSQTDEESVIQNMQSLTKYGDVALYTRSAGDADSTSAERFAAEKFQQFIGNDEADGILLLIDMKERMIYLETHGRFASKISVGKANSITDSVYRYASNGQYARCAKEAFKKSGRMMEGGFVFSKLKIVSNLLIAFMCSIILNFFVLRQLNRKKKTEAQEFSYANKGHTDIREKSVKEVSHNTVRIRNSSGSHYGGGGGFRSGGGGGFHSHGGGHRF